jgi:putative transposase
MLESNQIRHLMREADLACQSKRKFKATMNSRHDLPIAPNPLDRQFAVKQPSQAYLGDVTYIPTQEGWLYLAVVIDLFSRQAAGWSMAEHMRAKRVNEALLMAICHLWIMNCGTKLLNRVSGKVLTHQL